MLSLSKHHHERLKRTVLGQVADNYEQYIGAGVDKAFKDYLTQVEQACKAGNATEHTHRPALKDLLEAFQPGIVATNEPKRIKCGAPDYIITRKDIPSYDDLTHYRGIVAALARTIELQAAIDDAIGEWPLQ